MLRASGPLKHLGVSLGGYVGKGFGSVTNEFRFRDFPTYSIPVEIKRDSTGFKYQRSSTEKKAVSRAVVLCAIHRQTDSTAH